MRGEALACRPGKWKGEKVRMKFRRVTSPACACQSPVRPLPVRLPPTDAPSFRILGQLVPPVIVSPHRHI